MVVPSRNPAGDGAAATLARATPAAPKRIAPPEARRTSSRRTSRADTAAGIVANPGRTRRVWRLARRVRRSGRAAARSTQATESAKAAPAGAPIATAGLPSPGQRRGDRCGRPERCHAENTAEAGPHESHASQRSADLPHAPRTSGDTALRDDGAAREGGDRGQGEGGAQLAGPRPSPPASASANASSDGPTTITAPTAGTRQCAITTLAARTGAAAIWPPSAERSGSETATPVPATTAASIGPATTASATPSPLAPASSSASACPTRQNADRRDENPRNEDECRQRRRRDDAEQTPEVAAGNRLRERRAHP